MTPTVTRRLVVVGTAAVVIAAVGYVLRFGSNCPVVDEWDLTFELLRDGPPWIFDRHNEHRYITPKAVWLGLLRVSGFDYRAGMFASIGFLAVASGLALAAAVRWRGRWSAADLLIPAGVFHWGHYYTFLMGYQLAFSLVVLGFCGVSWACASLEPGRERVAAWRAVPFVVLLATLGGFGVATMGPLLIWLVWVAVRFRLLDLGVVAAVLGLIMLVVVGSTPPSPVILSGDQPVRFLSAVGLYLLVGWGSDLPVVWPMWVLVGVSVAGVVVAGWVGRVLLLRPADRFAVGGLAALWTGHLLIAVALAVYRGGGGGARFTTPSVGGWVVLWLLLVRCRVAVPPWLAVAAAAILLAVNLKPGADAGLQWRGAIKGFLADVAAGTPAVELSGKYGGMFLIYDPHGRTIAALRDARIGPFANLPPDPTWRLEPIADRPDRLPAWSSGSAPVTVLPLPPPTAVGFALTLEPPGHSPWQELRVEWTSNGRPEATWVRPATFPRPHRVLVRFPAGAADLRIRPICETAGFVVHSAEWLIPVP